MMEPVLLFLGGLVGTLLLTPLVIRLALRWGVLDHPGDRKVHTDPVPRLGGVAIFAVFGLAAIGAVILSDRIRTSFLNNEAFWLSLAAGGTIVFLLGVYDDIRGARVWTKFVVQFAAAGIAIGFGKVLIRQLVLPWDGTLQFGSYGIVITALWIVGVTNALNLIDGLDGLAGGVAFISVVTIFLIALILQGRSLMILSTAVLAGSLLGFLHFNSFPARIFLGDSGSMFLGYTLAVISVVGSSKRTTTLALVIPILVLGIPVFDTLTAMARRLAKKVLVEGEWRPRAFMAMFRADREHIHHALLEMGYTHRGAVLVLYGLALIFSAFALVASVADNDRVSFGLLLIGALAFLAVRRYGKHLLLGFQNGRAR